MSPKPSTITTSSDTDTTAASGSSSSGLDEDKDNDNPTKSYYDSDDNAILSYGRKASAAEERTVTAAIEQYYAAAATADGAKACSLLLATYAETVAEEYPQQPGLGTDKTCAGTMSRIFQQHHRQLTEERSTVKVKGVRIEDQRGWAVLGFGANGRPGRMLVHREGGTWKVNQLLRIEMP